MRGRGGKLRVRRMMISWDGYFFLLLLLRFRFFYYALFSASVGALISILLGCWSLRLTSVTSRQNRLRGFTRLSSHVVFTPYNWT